MIPEMVMGRSGGVSKHHQLYRFHAHTHSGATGGVRDDKKTKSFPKSGHVPVPPMRKSKPMCHSVVVFSYGIGIALVTNRWYNRNNAMHCVCGLVQPAALTSS